MNKSRRVEWEGHEANAWITKGWNIYYKISWKENSWKNWRARQNRCLYMKIWSRLNKPRTGSSCFCDDSDLSTGSIKSNWNSWPAEKLSTDQGSLMFT
jgi:hypothetical protein